MTLTSSIAATLVAVVGGIACGGTLPQAVVSARASSDFSCPRQSVEVLGIGGASYQATGCGMTATYSCNGVGNVFDPVCTREGRTTLVTGVTAPQGK